MKLLDLVKKNRSYRRYIQSEKMDIETLTELVELARFSASVRKRNITETKTMSTMFPR